MSNFSFTHRIPTSLRRLWKTSLFAALISLGALLTQSTAGATEPWLEQLRKELPLLGHRNWIAIVDSAYPLQISPGIETIETNSSQLEVTQAVLAELAKAKHVRPIIYTDLELSKVPEADAPGVTAYRDGLAKVLNGKPVNSLLHEEIIGKLDEAGKTFRVVILKTNLTIPYTSVFLQLDCGYWNPEARERLHAAMGIPSTK